MLMSVVFPAPFGPMTACTSPMWHSRETSFTAASPPKWRASSWARSTIAPRAKTSVIIARLFALPSGAQPDQPVREQQHHQDDEAAHEQLPVLAQIERAKLRQGLESQLEQYHCLRAQDRPHQRTHPTQDHHHHHRAGQLPAEHEI